MVTHSGVNLKSENQQGFTLVELAIVLVIIGLIIGGVLVGQDMIKSAQIRSQISQIEKLNTAVNAFRGKYGFLPGDIPVASTYWTANNGDGNGLITDVNGTINNAATDFDTMAATSENMNVFVHLGLAALTEGSYSATMNDTPIPTNFPRMKLSQNGLFPLSIYGLNYWHAGFDATKALATTPALTAAGFSNNTLTPYQAQNIDQKVDDGAPSSGGVLAKSGATNALVYAVIAYSATTCATAATAYNVGTGTYNDIPLCQLQFRWN